LGERKSGVLLHVTSLPGEEGIGTLGGEAREFARVLAASGQRLWQILPVHPTIVGDSPFQGPSVFAGNPNLVSLAELVRAGDLAEADYAAYLEAWRAYRAAHPGRSDAYVEYGFLWERKLGFDSRLPGWEAAPLRRAWEGFRSRAGRDRREAFEAFVRREARWLEPYALFMALKELHGFETLWCGWSEPARSGPSGAGLPPNDERVGFYKYVQFVFDEQISALRDAAHGLGVELVGDLAIYPGYDSADVWANRSLFQLDSSGAMTHVAAVPPDYFSATGQLWGNPLYRWGEAGSEEDHARIYSWWAKRLERELRYFDMIKVDHFRGLESYGCVEAGAPTAVNAKWVRGPGLEFFEQIERELGRRPPLIAEDLGIITDAVRRLLRKVGYPGMKVFIFADWRGDPRKNRKHPYLPHNVARHPNSVFYTGTHDNETLRQKIELGMTDEERSGLELYLERSGERELHWKVVDVISASASETAIFPAQDLLYLGPEARMNNPSQSSGWWRWRLTVEQMRMLAEDAGPRLAGITRRHGRCAP